MGNDEFIPKLDLSFLKDSSSSDAISLLSFSSLEPEEFRFRLACEQVVLLNNKLGDQQIRYDRARRDQMKSFRYNIRLRMSSLEGVRNVYYEYARQKAAKNIMSSVNHDHSINDGNDYNAGPSENAEISSGIQQSKWLAYDNLALNTEENGEENIDQRISCKLALDREVPLPLETRNTCSDKIGVYLKIAVTLSNCLMIAMATGFLVGLGVFFVGIIDEFKISRSRASPMLSVFTAIFFGGGGLVGPFMKKCNGGVLCMIGSVLTCVGCIVTSFAPSVDVLIFSVGVLAGIGMTVPLILPFVTVGEIYTDHRDLVLTTVQICPAIGSIIFPYLTSQLVEMFGWRGGFLIMAGIYLNLVPIGYINAIVKKRMQSQRKSTTDKGIKWKEMFDCYLFRNPLYDVLSFCVFLMNTMYPLISLFFIDMLRDKGVDISLGSLLLSATGFANIAGRIFTTVVGRWLPLDRNIHWVLYLVLCAASMSCYPYFTSYTILMAVSVVLGLFWGMGIVSYPAMLLRVSGPQRYPSAMGYCNLIGGIGGIILSPLAGLIKDTSGSYDMVFLLTGGLSVTSACILTVVHFKKRPRNDESKPETQVKVITLEKFTYIE